ncbi:MAG TPA: hypothetical protein VN725_03245 [Rhodanobacteraceae bacterium]|nr:hypothetical protein [Rhodanobacteraceae bacterium]
MDDVKEPILIWITQCLSVLLLTFAFWGVVRLFFELKFAVNPLFSWDRFLTAVVVQISLTGAVGAVLYATIARPKWALAASILFSLGLTATFIYTALHPSSHPVFQVQPGTAEAVGAAVGNWVPAALAIFYAWRLFASHEAEKYLTRKGSMAS